MLDARAEVTIAREPRAILEWVLDLDRYRQVDHKIRTIAEYPRLDPSGRGRARYRGNLRGLPGPMDTQDVRLERWTRLTFTGAPGVWTRRSVDFEGSFECTPADGGTRVVHRERFLFKPAPVRWLVERYLRRWLDADIQAEMRRLKSALEQG